MYAVESLFKTNISSYRLTAIDAGLLFLVLFCWFILLVTVVVSHFAFISFC